MSYVGGIVVEGVIVIGGVLQGGVFILRKLSSLHIPGLTSDLAGFYVISF